MQFAFPDKYKNAFKTIVVLIVLLLMAFVVVMQGAITPWSATDLNTDSGVYRYVALEMTKGGMPYLDTFDHKGPLLYLINFAGMIIGYLNGIWLIELVSLWIALCFSYATARLFCSRKLSLLAVLICIGALFGYFQQNMTEEFSLPFIACSLYFFLDYFVNGKFGYIRAAICGVCLGCVLMLRANMIATWVAFPVGMAIVMFKKQQAGQFFKYAATFILGSVISIAPEIAWLASAGALDSFIKDYIFFNVAYSSADPEMPVAQGRWKSFATFLNNAMVMAAFLIVGYKLFRQRRFLDGVYLAYLVLAIASVCLSGRGFAHYMMIIAPALIYPTALVLDYASGRKIDYVKPVAIVVSLYMTFVCAAPPWFEAIEKAAASYYSGGEYSEGLTYAVDYVKDHTKQKERISVYGNWDSVYVLTHRLSASKYSYQFSIGTITDTGIMDEYFNDLEREKPPVIVVQAKILDDRMKDFASNNGYSMVWNQKRDGSGVVIFDRNAESETK